MYISRAPYLRCDARPCDRRAAATTRAARVFTTRATAVSGFMGFRVMERTTASRLRPPSPLPAMRRCRSNQRNEYAECGLLAVRLIVLLRELYASHG